MSHRRKEGYNSIQGDELAPYYTETSGKKIPTTARLSLKDQTFDEIVEQYSDEEEFRVLDVGCGGAGYHPSLRKRLDASIDAEVEIIGIDLNKDMLEDVKDGAYPYARGWGDIHTSHDFEAYGNTATMNENERNKLKLVAGDAFRLPFKDESFDATISQYLATHYKTEHDELESEVKRVTKDDGYYNFID